jgi:HK97 family phage major capsid protein
LKNLFRKRDPANLDPLERKSLSSFSFGSNSFLLAPEMSNRVLSCLADPTDLASLMGQASTSSGSLRFFIDNARIDIAGWACEAACFANNPQPDLSEGLGEMEIKAETLRYVACAGNDLLADASFNIEQWVLRKVADAFRRKISDAIVAGTGIGMPQGILNPNAGIPICDTSPATPTGQFSWQDLVMLKMEVPMQWPAGGSYLMNQRTFALLMTMSDATGRPLIGTLQTMPGFGFMGTPIQIVTQMPDVGPGATPVAYGDWRNAYLVVTRQGTNMIADPYSAGWCTLFKFDCRIGGAVTCSNAARLLRIR